MAAVFSSRDDSVWSFAVFALMVFFLPGVAGADPDSFTDLARVVGVEEMTRTVQVPVRRERCEPEHAARDEFREAGNVRALHPEFTIADAILDDLNGSGSRAGAGHCRWVTEHLQREESRGFRVTYEYAGETYTRVMDEPPGDNVRVRVALEPD